MRASEGLRWGGECGWGKRCGREGGGILSGWDLEAA